MRKYNIYYNNVKINNRPLDDNEIKDIMKSKQIYKHDPMNKGSKELLTINTNKLKVIETIIV